MLVSGSLDFLNIVMSKLNGHVGPFIHAMEFVFTGHRMHLMEGLYKKWGRECWSELGLLSVTVADAEFGGMPSARHLFLYRGVKAAIFSPGTSLQRKLSHVIQPAAPMVGQEIKAPEAVDNPFPHHPWPTKPIYHGGLMHPDRLYDVTCPQDHIACQCVFKKSGWVCRALTPQEFLRTYDIPLCMDNQLLAAGARPRSILVRNILPMVASSICHAMWSKHSGEGVEMVRVQPKLRLKLPLGNNTREEERDKEGALADDVSISKSSMESRGSCLVGDDTSSERIEPHRPTLQATTIIRLASQSTEKWVLTLFDKLKEEHDMAKAMKSNNARVPVHLWDEGVVRREPTEQEKDALTTIRLFCLRIYSKGLWRDDHAHLVSKFGRDWARKGKGG